MDCIIKVVRFPGPIQTPGYMFVFDNDTDLMVDGCATVELPWRDNHNRISCILEGRYKYQKLQSSPTFKYPHLEVIGVPMRSGIKVHIANYSRQLLGCTAVGKYHKMIDADNLIDVAESTSEMAELIRNIPDTGTIEFINLKI